MKTYNHAFDIAFSLSSICPTGDNVTESELIAALEKRLQEFKDNPGLAVECAGMPFDTYEEE